MEGFYHKIETASFGRLFYFAVGWFNDKKLIAFYHKHIVFHFSNLAFTVEAF